jgi:uncharacterized membrane protein required for colicin V production
MFVTNLDMLVLIGVLVGAIAGMCRGITRGIFDLAAIVTAAAAAIIAINEPYLVRLGRSVLNTSPIEVFRVSGAPELAVGGLTFVVVLAIGWILSKQVTDLITNHAISSVDRSLGLAFGAGKGFMIVVIMILVNATAFETLGPQAWQLKRKNYSYPFVKAAAESVVEVALPFLPPRIGRLASSVRL